MDSLSLSLSVISLLFDVVAGLDEGSSDGVGVAAAEDSISGSVGGLGESRGGGGLEATTSQVPLSRNRKYNGGEREGGRGSHTCYLQLDRSGRQAGTWGHTLTGHRHDGLALM